MPLPDARDTPWPPEAWKPALARITEAKLWYTGDPVALAEHYSRRTITGDPQGWKDRVKFWARAAGNTTDAKPAGVHYPAAAKIASTAADLLFGDPFTLAIDEARAETPDPAAQAAQDRLEQLAETDGWQAKLLEAAEVSSGLGAVYLRPLWDPQLVADRPLLTVVHQDHAVPVFRHGILVSVVFWKVLEQTSSGVVWRHLEEHTAGRVEHGLYEGNARELGRRHDLADHTATAGLAAAASRDGTIDLRPLGITGLLPEYVPNRLPNRWDPASPVGCSDTATFEPLMDMLDQTVTSWLRDVDLGKRRIIVPDEFLDRGGKGAGAWFDSDREVFAPLAMDPSSREKASIEVVDFAIRAADHDSTMRSLFEAVVTSAGYSPQSFGLHGDGAVKTATEVDANEGSSDRTTGKKRGYYGPAIAATAHKMLAIDAAVFRSGVTPVRPRVEWPQPEDDPVKLGQVVNSWELAGAASTETKVRTVHPDWDDETVQTEVERIRAERGVPVDDPTGGFP